MWSFLNPLFLWAAAAAVIPLVLHLLQRRRTVKVPFSTIRFLKVAQKRSASRVRLENFLLWLVRTVLLALLALAFALPVVRARGWGNLLGTANRDVAIVWDVSYSMGYESGNRRTWDIARNTVANIVQGLRKGDRVCIFLADDEVTPLIEQPTSDLDLALSLIKAQTVRTGSSQLQAATSAAGEALKNSGQREREVYLVTDGQAVPWEIFRHTEAGRGGWNPKILDRKVAFFVALIGASAPQNVAPLAVELQPHLLFTNTAANLTVKLGVTGPAQDTSVALFLDDREISRRSITLGANGDLVFPLPLLTAGTHAGRVETPADGLAIDNVFHFLLRVKEQLPVLCAGAEADAYFLTRALNPGRQAGEIAADQPDGPVVRSGITVKRIDPEAIAGEKLAEYAAIFLSNALPLPGQAVLDLEDYVRRGGTLVLFPGDRAVPADYQTWTCLPAKPQSIAEAEGESVRQPLRLIKPHDPLFTYLKLPPGTVPAVSIRRQLAWGKLEPDSEPVIASGGNTPFLLIRNFGSGRVLMFAVAADRRWSDLPLSPFFLPIIHQIVEFGAGAGRGTLSVWTTRNAPLAELIPEATIGGSLLSPKQEVLPVRRVKKGNKETLELDQLTEPGLYRLPRPDGAPGEPVLAVNVPRVESDLKPINANEVPGLLGIKDVNVARDTEELARQIEAHRVGRPLHESLLWAVFGLALFELFLANRLSRRAATVTDRVTIEASGRVLTKTT